MCFETRTNLLSISRIFWLSDWLRCCKWKYTLLLYCSMEIWSILITWSFLGLSDWLSWSGFPCASDPDYTCLVHCLWYLIVPHQGVKRYPGPDSLLSFFYFSPESLWHPRKLPKVINYKLELYCWDIEPEIWAFQFVTRIAENIFTMFAWTDIVLYYNLFNKVCSSKQMTFREDWKVGIWGWMSLLTDHKTFKSALFEFYQQHGIAAKALDFKVADNGGLFSPVNRRFSCQLSIPAIRHIQQKVRALFPDISCLLHV